MREKELVQQELEEKEQMKQNLKSELSAHEAALSPQIEPLRRKIGEIEESKQKIVTPKASPIFAIIALLFAILAIANLVYFKVGYLTLAAGGLMVVVLIIRHIKQKNLNRPFEEERKKKENEIKDIETSISKIEETDPQIAQLRKQISSMNSAIRQLNLELRNIAILEKIGTNNLIISVNNKNSKYVYLNSDGKVARKDRYFANIQVDGADKGSVVGQLMIIPLSQGIHSLSVEFDPRADGYTYTLNEGQFSLKDSNKYISYKKMDNNLTSKKKGFTVDRATFDHLDDFLEHAEMTKEEFESYIIHL